MSQTLFDIGKKDVQGWDADASEQWLRWYDDTGYPYTVNGNPRTSVAQSIMRANTPDIWNVVDVGHLEDHRDVGLAVCKYADVAIINCAATLSDFERLYKAPIVNTEEKPDKGFLEATALVRADEKPIPSVVLMTRVDARKSKMNRQIREMLIDEGHKVLETVIPDINLYAQTGGGMPLETSWIERRRDDDGEMVETAFECAHAAVLDELHARKLVPAWRA